jgi:hypothetical protein
MSRLPAFALAVAALLMAACNRSPGPPAAAPSAPAPAPSAGKEAAKGYGAALAAATPVALAKVMATPEAFADRIVTVEGQVRKACTRKGCWMEIADSQQTGTPGCRVTFKNYGFFVPTDAAGSRARVQGKVEVDVLSAAAVRHYEEEGAAFAKAADGTAREIRIVATGVELRRVN